MEDHFSQVLFKILAFLYGISKILCLWIVGTVKALLPSNVLPQKDFTNNVILVTGSGGGLGRQFSIRVSSHLLIETNV
jgi:hypothetical protein